MNLANNMTQGQQRPDRCKKTILRNPQFKTDYSYLINRRFERELSEYVPESQLEINYSRVWHLSHHAVCNVKKPKKIQVFFEFTVVFVSVSLYSQFLREISSARCYRAHVLPNPCIKER